MEAILTCFGCEMSLPPEAKFCLECGAKVRCGTCATALVKGSKFCFNCGDAVAAESKSTSAMNSIEFNESENGRNFKAAFTDSVGKSISESFGQFMANRLNQTKSLPLPSETQTNNRDTIDVKVDEVENAASFNSSPKKLNSNVERIFREKEGKVTLVETRLKAIGKLDYAKRLTYLFLLYNKEKGNESVARSSITSIMESVGLNDPNFRAWISSAADLLNEDDKVSLRIPGEEISKKCLSDIFNEAVEEKWTLENIAGKGPSTKSRAKPSKQPESNQESSTSKNSKSKTESYQFIDLGLNEKDREDLRSFYEDKNPKGQNDIVLVLAYWLKAKGNRPLFDENVIYSAIQIVDAGTPKVLSQVLRNIKNESKIVKVQDGYKLNHVGEDYVKLKMKPKK